MAGRHGSKETPLAGAILCCTSIPPEERSALANIGAQMGATIKLDLTSDVTHLIVGNTNSAKYRYVAKAREDVKVLRPEWMEALRTEWMLGEEVDTAALEKEYRLPTFYQLKICLTGFDNPDQRKHIQDAVVANGAEYHGDLTKAVTHLIAAAPTGKKYEHALNWRMKVVSIEWFEQSLERGMALDEQYFNPTMPVEERGKGAWDRRKMVSPSLGKRTRDVEQPTVAEPHRRKLRRSASTKMGSQSEALWAGITAMGSPRQTMEGTDDWNEESLIRPNPTEVIDAVDVSEIDQGAVPEDPALEVPAPPSNAGIFQGRLVFPFGFDAPKTKILRDYLTCHGAAVIQDAAELLPFASHDLTRGYLVVPADARTDLTSLPGAAGAMTRATNWWVERCLHSKCLANPAEHILCRPLNFNNIPIQGFEQLMLNSTGFTGVDLLHMTSAAKLMGAKYDDYLTTKTSVLICNTRNPNPEKLNFATIKRIPAVHAPWLWECLQAGNLQPFGGHILNKIEPQPQISRQKPQHPTPTVPLSSEDSERLRKKKAQAGRAAAVRPQKLKGQGLRSRPLDLALSADSALASTNTSKTNENTNSRIPFLEDDDDDDDGFAPIPNGDGPASQPLQDIHPGVNSPRRPSTSSTSSNSTKHSTKAPGTKSTTVVKKAPTPDSMIPPETNPRPATVPEEKDYSEIMSNILAQRRAAAAKQSENKASETTGRRRRQLGRATSNPSSGNDRSTIMAGMADGDTSLLDHMEGKVTGYQPSQELGWDAPGAQESRERMIRAMGGRVEQTAEVIETIGVLKDMSRRDDVGLASGRAGRRRRG